MKKKQEQITPVFLLAVVEIAENMKKRWRILE